MSKRLYEATEQTHRIFCFDGLDQYKVTGMFDKDLYFPGMQWWKSGSNTFIITANNPKMPLEEVEASFKANFPDKVFMTKNDQGNYINRVIALNASHTKRLGCGVVQLRATFASYLIPFMAGMLPHRALTTQINALSTEELIALVIEHKSYVDMR